MKHMVSYKLKTDCVAENERLARAVFAALKRANPPGLRYATFKQSDGLSFVHIVAYDEDDGNGALTGLPEFKAFAEGIKQRCETPPVRVDLTEIGSHGFFSG
jgi:hypothetical protein